jgi:hypothetical protein
METGASHEQISRVPEAQGMVCTQVDCTREEALELLNERAKATGLRLEEVAVAVVNRRTQFRHGLGNTPA